MLSAIDLRPGKTAAQYRSLYHDLKSLALANDNGALDRQALPGEVCLRSGGGEEQSYSLSYREGTSTHAEALQVTRSQKKRQGRPVVEWLRLQPDPSGYLEILYGERMASGDDRSIKEVANLARDRVTRIKDSSSRG